MMGAAATVLNAFHLAAWPVVVGAAGGGQDPGPGQGALFSFCLYLAAVFVLAYLSGRGRASGAGKGGRAFVDEYFLGGRSLGVWALALTFAATSSSGGSFVGFPALIYSHGWVLALWIAGYMMVPLVGMALLGKRLNRVARRSGAITVPEIIRARFGSPAAGVVATQLIVFFFFCYLLAQFKAGSKILTSLLEGEPAFETAVGWVAGAVEGVPWVGGADPEYLLSLVVFSIAVIAYVVYGGFRAVVWTDVLQGALMFFGVVLLLGLTLYQVGGLGRATRELAEMVPPLRAEAVLERAAAGAGDGGAAAGIDYGLGTWVRVAGSEGKLCRLRERGGFAAGELRSGTLEVLVLQGDRESARVPADAIEPGVVAHLGTATPYAYGAGKPGVYVSAPGPHADSASGFLALAMAFSFFIFWPFGTAGQASNMVRLMAFRDTGTLQRALVTVTVYYSFIYFSLVVIFCCGRVLMPGMEVDPDRVMPDLALRVTEAAGSPWLAGLVLAAPFAAVMSSVDSFLLIVSSSLVRDIYQRDINPSASERRLKRVTYGGTILVGIAATLGALNPPEFLQSLIVFASGGVAASFLVPVALALYWPRMTGAGAVAGMLGGCLTHLALYLAGYLATGEFQVYRFLGVQPFVWDLLCSALCAVAVSLRTPPPAEELVERYF